jgi:hypothetical protein
VTLTRSRPIAERLLTVALCPPEQAYSCEVASESDARFTDGLVQVPKIPVLMSDVRQLAAGHRA